MVFWCQGSNGVKSGASCILSVRVLMGGMLGGILGDGAGIGCIPGDRTVVGCILGIMAVMCGMHGVREVLGGILGVRSVMGGTWCQGCDLWCTGCQSIDTLTKKTGADMIMPGITYWRYVVPFIWSLTSI